MTRSDAIERVPELTPAQKEIALLHIAASMGGTFDSSDEPWNWLNWFCDDAGNETDTFNRCNEKGWLFTTHDSDNDTSRTVLTTAGRAALERSLPAATAVEAPNSQPLVTHIRPARDGDPICYAWQVCAGGEEGAVPVYEDKNGRHIVDMTDIRDFRKRIASAIFDPGATEGLKGDRDLTTWQTDAVMRMLGVNIDRIAEGLDNG